MKPFKNAILIAALLLGATVSNAQTHVLRANQLGAADWSALQDGKLDQVVIEFRQGDELPLRLVAQGDLLESKEIVISTVVVKRSFWIRPTRTALEISLDGQHFTKPQDALSGSLEVGSGADENGGAATGIGIFFKAFLKR
jgi:hypothetical protein